ncbi:MAG: extracellular solute-binding protein [Propionibacteriaceae bacterium]|jgi:multiple sugar transport system substrate-binding protein|nr:extracellular solute-binding protein [Propionibacteriaceae bacterium]
MKKSRKILAITAASALVFGMGACSGNPGTGSSSAGGDSKAPVEITYLHRLPDGEGMVKVDDIVARWNKEHPEIQVKATKFDGNAQQMIQRLETDVNANNGPCLGQLGYNEVPEFYSKGLVLDVTTEANKYKDKFSGAFGQMSTGGKISGLPQDTGPLVYFYNETEFKNLGITVPKTLDEFKTAAAKAAVAGKYIADFTPDEVAFWLSAQTAAAGGVWYGTSGDQWKVQVDSPASQKVATFWQDMIDAKSVLTLDRWGDAYGKALTDGQLIGNIAAAWEFAFLLDPLNDTPAEGQWRVAQIPDFGAGAKTGPDGGSGVAVMKGCEHPVEAMQFNAWFNTQVDDLTTQGLVVAALGNPKTPAKALKQFGGQEIMKELATANKNLSMDFAYIPGFSAVGPKAVETAAEAAKGTAKVADVFTTAQQASIDALKAAGLSVAQ